MSRKKGHNFERKIAKVIRENLGHTKCRTTRSSSRMLDACGIDLIGTNLLWQCKSGYPNRRPRFEEEYDYIKNNLQKNFSKDSPVQSYPIVLAYELNVGAGHKRGPQHTQITLTLEDFINIMLNQQKDILDIL
jgi:hypothetical protein